jgi:NADH-quinone oxidoreductase subunit H
MQWVAEAIKLTLKQVMVPRSADRFLFLAAPVAATFPFLMVYLVVPFGPGVQGADLDVGLLFVFAITSLSFPAFFMAGISSNNKYAFLGGMRAVAQVIAFEIPLTLLALGVVLLAGSLRLSAIVEAQRGLWFLVPQAIGAGVFVIAGMAENAIHPFDLIEAESEIVTGYYTEYSSMLAGLFLAVEIGTTFTLASVFTTLFLGGWQPIVPIGFVPPIAWFLMKGYAMFGLLALIRLSMPRFRIDQFLSLGWKILAPLAFINLFVAAAEATVFGRT